MTCSQCGARCWFQHMINYIEPQFQIPHRKTWIACCPVCTWRWRISRALHCCCGVVRHYYRLLDTLCEWSLHWCHLPCCYKWMRASALCSRESVASSTAPRCKHCRSHEECYCSMGTWFIQAVWCLWWQCCQYPKGHVDFLFWKCLGCFGHTVNLCVKAGLKQHQVETAVSHCSRLTAFFRKSSQVARVHNTKQEALD